jgi:RND family efflux transporter MFP subunit
VLVEEGHDVKKGDVLVRIDMSDLESALEERVANLEAAKSQLTLAKKNLDAKVKLAAKGYAARLTVNEVESAYEASAASVRAIEAQVDAARRALAKAEVKAPMSGIVATRSVNPGDKVSVDTPLLTIVSLDEMEVDAPVPASEIGRVMIGQLVTFTVPGLVNKKFEGIVERINPVARAGTRSIPVYIHVDNEGGLLRGGMFAEGEIVIEEAADVLAIPAEALRHKDGESYVLKLEGGRIRRQQVLADQENGGELIEVTGLSAGDKIIAASAIELPPETPVRVSGL